MGATTGEEVGGVRTPKNLDPNFLHSFLVGSDGGNRLRQTGYTVLISFWRRAVIPQTKKLDPPTLKTWLQPLSQFHADSNDKVVIADSPEQNVTNIQNETAG